MRAPSKRLRLAPAWSAARAPIGLVAALRQRKEARDGAA
jgi:hypothetical protein